jgi:hypothetical protein
MVRWKLLAACVAVFLCATGAFAGDNYPVNQQPMYGGPDDTSLLTSLMTKNSAEVLADMRLIDTIKAKGLTRAQGSDQAVKLGWQYFFKKDYATAMKRFNQAWMLDSDNGDAFHGFALVEMERDHDSKLAEDFFRKGIAKPRQSPGIWLDFGRYYLKEHRPAEAVAPLRKAVGFSDMGPWGEILLTTALFESGDKVGACVELPKVKKDAMPSDMKVKFDLLIASECKK